MFLQPHVIEHVSLDLQKRKAPFKLLFRIDKDDYSGLTVYTSFTNKLPSEVEFD